MVTGVPQWQMSDYNRQILLTLKIQINDSVGSIVLNNFVLLQDCPAKGAVSDHQLDIEYHHYVLSYNVAL